MSILLVTIATGEMYRKFARKMFASAAIHFPEAHPFVITDGPEDFDNYTQVSETEPKGFPKETLFRYDTMLRCSHRFKSYDYVFYIDADMLFVDRVEDKDITADGITATLHPGYVGTRGTPETNPISRAFCKNNTAYYCGGFQGGITREYLFAMVEMATNIGRDADDGVMAVWHDESHWNRFLANNPPAKVLSPDYCYPDVPNDYYRNKWAAAGMNVSPKILALEKKR